MAADGSAESLEQIHAAVVARLRSQRSEIEQAIYAHIHDAVPDPAVDHDIDYQAGLTATVTALVEYSLKAIERPDQTVPIPQAAAAQARHAARAGVRLGTVLRRYLAGYRQLVEFITKEAEQSSYPPGRVRRHLSQVYGPLIEGVTAAVEREYVQELERTALSREQRRAEIVQRLLSDEPVDPAELAELDYEFHTYWHLGVIATGVGAEEILRCLKAGFSGKLLPVLLDGTVWAWLGGHRSPTVVDIERLLTNGHVGLSLAIGEPGRGIDGWRLTHHQAQAALAVALRKPERFARYADGPLLAAALQNDTLAKSLKQKYLTPLSSQRDAGMTLRQTLRAHIDAECIATSAASALGVGRHTVESRVRTVEKLIGRALRTCLAELDVALRLEELAAAPDDPSPTP